MARYTITTNGDRCVANDNEHGVALDWLAGAYEDTAEYLTDQDTAATDADVCRELYAYVKATRPDLL